MRIAVIGAGNVGGSLGRGWSKRGHQVRYGVPNPADAKYRDLPAVAAADADAIVLATPWPATEAAVRGLGDLSGRLVIDCTNPLGMGADGLGLVVGHSISGGELIAQWAPGAAVFKTFNTTGFNNMADLSGYPDTPVMFVAGDDSARKPAVLDLVRDIGFEAIDAGPLLGSRDCSSPLGCSGSTRPSIVMPVGISPSPWFASGSLIRTIATAIARDLCRMLSPELSGDMRSIPSNAAR